MTKAKLSEIILRRFGYPMVKVELDYSQISDAIDYARDKFIRYATGNATQEVYFTMALSAGRYLYDMPTGVVDVLTFEDTGVTSGINTLFTIENYMYSQGMFEGLINTINNNYTLLSYHIALDFLETLRRYSPSTYNFKYHPYANQLEIQPPPVSGNSLTYTPKYITESGTEVAGEEITIDSPGFILIRAMMITGSTRSPSWTRNDGYEDLYNSQWILDYATAMCKKTLGMIRRKFSGFSSMGNQGIALDGGELVSEANEEMDKLMEDLTLREQYEGYGIIIG